MDGRVEDDVEGLVFNPPRDVGAVDEGVVEEAVGVGEAVAVEAAGVVGVARRGDVAARR